MRTAGSALATAAVGRMYSFFDSWFLLIRHPSVPPAEEPGTRVLVVTNQKKPEIHMRTDKPATTQGMGKVQWHGAMFDLTPSAARPPLSIAMERGRG
jgi:hypothetical protein